ncbi:MAG: hypothetical protein EXR06_03130 [Rickettsiales bacterium]|nr:hypothetical protein [Rickettsiales bacterium]
MYFSNKAKNLLLTCLIAVLFSCSQDKVDPLDLTTGLSKGDFNKALIRDVRKDKKNRELVKQNSEEAPIPSTSRLIVVAPPPNTVTSKTISFAVTDQVPLKDVLIELGRVAKIDVDLDPSISGGIVINATNRHLGEVIDRIATLGKLRYSYDKGILHFERDTPYTINYSVDYLSEGSNLWTDVQANITALLSNSANTTSAATNAISATINAASASVVAADGTTKATVTPTSTATLAKSIVTPNKTAGILSIFATKAEHVEISKYLANVEENASAQVLIEAKVVEVKLTDAFKTGINWSSFGSKNNIISTNGFSAAQPLSFITSELFNSDITASISALETFGTTHTLSSPRIHAINNQKATLNFTNKLVYFKIDSNQNTSTTTGNAAVNTQTLTSTKQEENVGVELNIVPSINLKTGEVTLNIKPKITIKTGTVVDPASPKDPDTGVITFENKVPVIQTRELATIAKIQTGHVIVIGGLMSENIANTDSGIPFLQRIPILGYLFKSSAKDSEIIETVIFIKATIVNSGSPINKIDRELQETFDSNRRKFF